MNTRAALIACRLGLGLLVLAAVGAQLAIHLRLGYPPLNFFSYFTNLANLFAAAVFIAGAARLALGTSLRGAGDGVRGASVVNMAVVGIVFAVLLRDVDLGALRPWVNVVLHYVMPVAVFAEWWLAPPADTLDRRNVARWLVFPTLYLAYTLLRGAAIGWYPYPFLNPATSGGYGVVAAYCTGIFVLFLLAGWLVLAVGNARRRAPAG